MRRIIYLFVVLSLFQTVAAQNTSGNPWLSWVPELGSGVETPFAAFAINSVSNKLQNTVNDNCESYGIGNDKRGYIFFGDNSLSKISCANPFTKTIVSSFGYTSGGASIKQPHSFHCFYVAATRKHYLAVSNVDQSINTAGTVTILDVTNPAAMTFVKNIIVPSSTATGTRSTGMDLHQSAFTSAGTTLYVSVEDGDKAGVTGSGLFLKITDPLNASPVITAYASRYNATYNTDISHFIQVDNTNSRVYVTTGVTWVSGQPQAFILSFNTSDGSPTNIVYRAFDNDGTGSDYLHAISFSNDGSAFYAGSNFDDGGNRAYKFNVQPNAGSITVVDQAAKSPVLNYNGSTTGGVMGVNLLPDGSKLYAVMEGNGDVNGGDAKIYDLNSSTLALNGAVQKLSGTGDALFGWLDPHSYAFTLFDYGDAPSSYGIAAHNANNEDYVQDRLRIGATIDADSAAKSSANFDGDDLMQSPRTDDEDAITSTMITSASGLWYGMTGTYSINGITVRNATVPSVTATLFGWIDFNHDGVFQAAEGTSVSVPNGTTSVNLSWTIPSTVTTGRVLLRLRLTSDPLVTTSTPVSVAFDGEAEDHIFTANVPVSGNVFNDINANTIYGTTGTSGSTESGTTGGIALYAYLIKNGVIVDSARVAANGSYSFSNAPQNMGAGSVVIGTNSVAPGSASSGIINIATAPPSGWVYTGSSSATVSNGTASSLAVSIGLSTAPVSNQNFGIEQKPVAVNDVATGTIGNPVTVNPLANDSDPSGGSLDPTSVSLVTTGLPAGSSCTQTDAQGDCIAVTVPGQGVWTVDPVTGAITFTPEAGFVGNPTPIGYTVEDNAGFPSNVATVTITYPTVNISGTVVNDLNNSTTILDGTETGTTAGTTLWVYLVSSTGEIVDSVKVASNGTYTLQGSPSSTYTIELSTQQYAIGTAGITTSTINNNPPTGWVTTGEGANNTDDGTANGTLTVTTGTGNTTSANFGLEQPPVAVNDAATGTVGNPVTINPLTNDSDPSGGTLSPTSVSLVTTGLPAGSSCTQTDAQGDCIAVTVPGQGVWTVDPVTGVITFTPEAGFVGNPTPIGYTVDDNAGVPSNTATVTITYPTVNISGTVVNDLNNSTTILDGAETGTTAGTTLWVYLVSSTGEIVDSAKVASNGTYTLQGSPNSTYTVELSTQQYSIGTTGITSATINNTTPSGWIATGEGANNTDDGTVNGTLTVTTSTDNTTNVNFGLEQPPVAVNDNATGTLGNPVTINPLANDSDPSGGTLNPASVSLVTTGLPAGSSCTQTDAQGDCVQVTVPGQGVWTVDPVTGTITFTPEAGFVGNPTPIGYTVDDNAGVPSNTATVTITYPTVNIGGTVVNDLNNSTTILDGTETGTTAGTTLWVYLVSSTGEIVDSAKVAVNGTYTLQGSPNSTYTVELSTQQYAIGTTGIITGTINNNPPTGWVTTGEGTNNTDDGTANGTLTVTTTTGNITNANFGIEQPPVAVNDVTTGTLGNPVTVNPLTNDSDPSGGTLDPTSVSLVTTGLPAGSSCTQTDAQGDCVQVTVPGEGVWTVDPVTGTITFTPNSGFTGNPTPIGYTVDDNAGVPSNTATVTITYPTVSISGTVVNDLNNSTTILDGTETGTTAGTSLWVYLVSSSGVIVDSAQVAANGTYILQGSPGTAYTVELSTAQYAIGTTGITSGTINNNPPAGWVTTGEGANNTDDGTPDGTLTLTTGTGSTTNVNFGLQQTPPDLTPNITALPNIMNGTTQFNLTIKVTELNKKSTNGTITVVMPKDSRMSFTYDPALTTLGFTALNNAVWTYDGSHPFYHIFRTTSVIPAGGFSTFGMRATFVPGFTSGNYTLTSTIVAGSGGENRTDNNNDAEILDYFQN